MSEYVTFTQRRAQQTHTCNDCGLPILRGNEYISIRGQRGGRYFYRKTHIHCDAVINAYSAETGCEVDRSDLKAVVAWLRSRTCPGCINSQRCFRIGQDLFGCKVVLRRVLPPTVLSAALQSAQRKQTAYDRDHDGSLTE